MKVNEIPERIYDKTIKKFMTEFGCSKIERRPANYEKTVKEYITKLGSNKILEVPFLFYPGFKGKKTVDELSYDIEIFWDTGAIYISVTCLKPIKDELHVEVLKIINSSNIDELIAKYTIGVYDNQVSCTTFHSVLEEEQDIYSILDAHVDCSIGNVESIYDLLDD